MSTNYADWILEKYGSKFSFIVSESRKYLPGAKLLIDLQESSKSSLCIVVVAEFNSVESEK